MYLIKQILISHLAADIKESYRPRQVSSRKNLVPPARFELATSALGKPRSIQLSYEGNQTDLEPIILTSCKFTRSKLGRSTIDDPKNNICHLVVSTMLALARLLEYDPNTTKLHAPKSKNV